MQKEAYEIIAWVEGRAKDWLSSEVSNLVRSFVVREIDNLLSLQTAFFNTLPTIIFLSPIKGHTLSSVLESFYPQMVPTRWPVICCFEKADSNELLKLQKIGLSHFLFLGESHKFHLILNYYAACFSLNISSNSFLQRYNFFRILQPEREYDFFNCLPPQSLSFWQLSHIQEPEIAKDSTSPSLKAILATSLPGTFLNTSFSTSSTDLEELEEASYSITVWAEEEVWHQNKTAQLSFYASLLWDSSGRPTLGGRCDFTMPVSDSAPNYTYWIPLGFSIWKAQDHSLIAANSAFYFYIDLFLSSSSLSNVGNNYRAFKNLEEYFSHFLFFATPAGEFLTEGVTRLSHQQPECTFYLYHVSHFQTYRFYFRYQSLENGEPALSWIIQPLNSNKPPWLPLQEIIQNSPPIYAQIYENAPEAIFLVDGVSQLILDCNSAAVSLFQAEGKNQLVKIWGTLLHKEIESFPRITDLNFLAQSEAKLVLDVEYKTFKGKTFWGNLISQLFLHRQKFPYILAWVTDVSRNYYLESVQFQLAMHLNLVLEASGVVFWEWNMETNEFYYSQGLLALFEIEGKKNISIDFSFRELHIHPEDKARTIENFVEVLSGQKMSLTFEYRIITEKQNCKWVMETLRALSEFEKPRRVCGIIQDITERKSREKREAEYHLLLLKAILQGEDQERMRISQELHDGLGQQLQTILLRYALIVKKLNKNEIPSSEALEYLTHLLNEAAEETRRISHNLSPLVLEKHSLAEAITLFAQRIKDDKIPQIQLSLRDLPANLPTVISANIYRIVQELVQNSIKHAKAQQVNIFLNSYQNKILLLVEDDGIGLPSDWENKKDKGIGLMNVKTRVKLLGGRVVIQTGIRKGTAILIEIPLPPEVI